MTVPRKRPLACPIERFISALSGRWKAMIVWRLIERPLRFSSLEVELSGVPQRALSKALSELADDGVIARYDGAWHLTDLGMAMRPALKEMFSWGTIAQRS